MKINADFTTGRFGTRRACRHHGCYSVYVCEYGRAQHEKQPHFRCSCGRHFTKAGMAAHLRNVRRRMLRYHNARH